MMRPVKYTSAFAGIEGIGLGFDSVGMTCTARIEWDKNCQRVLREHFPDDVLLEDICDVHGTDIGDPDIMAGGFPCQDTSIAAPHRSGLAGSRSGHFFEFTRLVEEYQRLVDATHPRWVVIENTPGLLKSNGGRDMATVARCLEELGYGWAYRVVDARYLGSPERRERIIVVGHRGGDPRPAWQVLGDAGPGNETDSAHTVGRPSNGPVAVPSAGDGPVIWRKSARARASLANGGYETWVQAQHANTLTGFDGGGPLRQTHLMAQSGRLRGLTPLEWERLQMFPDEWTAMIPESARYQALGNAMHVGMAEWLGNRLMAVHAAMPQLQPIGG